MHRWFSQQRFALHRRRVLITSTEDRGWREAAIALDIGSSLLDIGYSTFYAPMIYKNSHLNFLFFMTGVDCIATKTSHPMGCL
jgi:hypothetical protein